MTEFYYAIMVARQNNTIQYTDIHANISTKLTKNKTIKRNRTDTESSAIADGPRMRRIS